MIFLNTLLAIDTGLSTTANAAGFGGSPSSIPVIVGKILNIVLGTLGIVFLILLVWGGILWMVAAGDQEKVKKATRLIVNSTIAVVITVAAYSIAQYVVNALVGALS